VLTGSEHFRQISYIRRTGYEFDLGHLVVRFAKQARNARTALIAAVSDMLIMTLGLLAGVVGCLARPCKPEQWTHVKAACTEPEAASSSAPERDFEPAPVSEPGFADGLAAAAA
jgi:hypothetical protein